MTDIKIIAYGGRRRRWSSVEKLRIVEGEPDRSAVAPRKPVNIDGTESISAVARRNGVAPNLLCRWHEEGPWPQMRPRKPNELMLEEGSVAVTGEDDVTSNKRVRQMEDRIRELERQFGRKTLEAEVLREALDKSRSKASHVRLP